ncbi:hypothetical protein [Clostridium lundense]|uniref:hypothetical protein n=1 Tax=Clostridium lundense TaxID=319475 RepID=UPI000A6095B3|nr:hypothetical protein [Clostridium lundense]
MKLISEQGWSIVPQDNSFLYYEMGDRGKEIGYFRYSFHNDNVTEIDKDTYSKGKYGVHYKKVLEYFKDDSVGPSCVSLEDSSIIVTEYMNSYIHKFDENGNLVWINESMGNYESIYSLAYEKDFLWCVYPTLSTIKKFSLNTFQEEVSIGKIVDGVFNYPEFAIVYDDNLYVCDMGNYRICIVDLNTNEVREYLKFHEPTWEYFQIDGKEIVRLQSGIYVLD